MIILRKISLLNFFQTCLLKRGNNNRKYIDSNIYSIITSIFKKDVLELLTIYDNDKVIGFIILSNYIKPLYIKNFMIDKKYQNQGYGFKAIIELQDYIKRNYKINKFFISTSNLVAIKLFKKCGFKYSYIEPYPYLYNTFRHELLQYRIN